MLFYLVQTNFVDLALVIFIYIFLLTNRTLDKKVSNTFFCATLLVNVLIIADSLDYYCSYLSSPSILRYITTATGYTLRPGAIIFILLNLNRYNSFKVHSLIVTFFMNMFLAYTSIFTKLMFFFDAQNQFHRGILGFMPFLVSAIYMIELTYQAILKYRMGAKKESTVIFLVAFMSIVAVCMETFFHFKFFINGIGAISIVFYYLFLHTQTYKRDALTNALNRHSFYIDIQHLSKSPMVIISLDINNLKVINDTQGHAMGDQAILTVANAIYAHLKPNCLLYRMGGDEFTILCPKMELDEATDFISAAEKDIVDAHYEIAWGLTKYNPTMNFEKSCSAADALMYERKKAMKHGNVR